MSCDISSRRRNYMLVPHRRDGLIEWMKTMLMHSFVLNALDSTGADTFSHVEMLIEEHRHLCSIGAESRSRLKMLVPTVGTFHTPLPLRRAFVAYDSKYGLTTRRHIGISFNEIRHILNLAQIMALSDASPYKKDMTTKSASTELYPLVQELSLSPPRVDTTSNVTSSSPPPSAPSHPKGDATTGSTTEATTTSVTSDWFCGPSLITFDGDQTLYSDGENFESNPVLANYLYLLLTHGVTVAVVTAAGYEYQTEKYELRLSGLLRYFEEHQLAAEDCDRFYLMGGECNYLLKLGPDWRLHPVKEWGPGGWLMVTRHKPQTPGNWTESEIRQVLDVSEETMKESMVDQKLRANVIRKKRSVGLIPIANSTGIPREALDETVLRVQERLRYLNEERVQSPLPYCAFNGGRDAWVDVGNKSVGVTVLQSYLGLDPERTLHIGDQFLHTGNDYAARGVCPCVWITSPEETTYILKNILRLADALPPSSEHQRKDSFGALTEMNCGITTSSNTHTTAVSCKKSLLQRSTANLNETMRRSSLFMDVYTGEMRKK